MEGHVWRGYVKSAIRGLQEYRGCRTRECYLAFCALAFSRFSLAQPSFVIWRALPRARESGGTSSVTVVAAATYAPFPMRTGAISMLSLPTKTPSSIMVLCL